MKKTFGKIACIALILSGLIAVSASAQVASYRDENGKLVFINANPPKAAKHPAAAPKAVAVKSATNEAQPADVTPDFTGQTAPTETVTTLTTAPRFANPAKAVAMAPGDLESVVQQSADKNHVDPALVRAVISTESNWNTGAVSSKGAMGLMQLMPDTAQRLGVGNAFDPAQNIGAGVQYLSMMLERYKGDVSKALAAYNAGPGAVDRFGGVPNFRETRNYVEKVTSNYFRPGSSSGQQPGTFAPSSFGHGVPIYRTTDSSGRVIFVNE
jgi:soluble lytic murein transglycosylase-like protein